MKAAVVLFTLAAGVLLFVACFAAIVVGLRFAIPYAFYSWHLDPGESPPESFPLIAEIPTRTGAEFVLVTWTGQLHFDQTHPKAQYVLTSPGGRASDRFVDPENKCEDATFETREKAGAQVVTVRACKSPYFYDARYRVEGKSIVPEFVRRSGGPGVGIFATLAGLGLAYPISSTLARRLARMIAKGG